MRVRTKMARLAARLTGRAIRKIRRGHGSVLPGHAALAVDPRLIESSRGLIRRSVIFITGTNGKSTTAYYLSEMLRNMNFTVATNRAGANMISGIAACLAEIEKPVDYAVLEVDEGSISALAPQLTPDYLIVLNLTRDQLDRYGEVAKLSTSILGAINQNVTMTIYNAGNPYAALLGHSSRNSRSYATRALERFKDFDAPICPDCRQGVLSARVSAGSNTISCGVCTFRLPQPDYRASYAGGLLRLSEYAIGSPNLEIGEALTVCAYTASLLRLPSGRAVNALSRVRPIMAHQQWYDINGYKVMLHLAKNPSSLDRIINKKLPEQEDLLIFLINNNHADGKDTSWLWDVGFERIPEGVRVVAGGQAARDLRVRLKVARHRAACLRDIDKIPSLLRRRSGNTRIIANYTAYCEIERLLSKEALPLTREAPHDLSIDTCLSII